MYVVHAYNPSTEAKEGGCGKLVYTEANLVYTEFQARQGYIQKDFLLINKIKKNFLKKLKNPNPLIFLPLGHFLFFTIIFRMKRLHTPMNSPALSCRDSPETTLPSLRGIWALESRLLHLSINETEDMERPCSKFMKVTLHLYLTARLGRLQPCGLWHQAPLSLPRSQKEMAIPSQQWMYRLCIFLSLYSVEWRPQCRIIQGLAKTQENHIQHRSHSHPHQHTGIFLQLKTLLG